MDDNLSDMSQPGISSRHRTRRAGHHSQGEHTSRVHTHISGHVSHVEFAEGAEGLGSFDAMNLKNLEKIRAKVNTGLTNADGSKNSRIIKQNLELMKNPIIAAIRKTLKISEKKDARTQKEYQVAMVPSKIYELMDNVMQEKIWIDIESESCDLVNR